SRLRQPGDQLGKIGGPGSSLPLKCLSGRIVQVVAMNSVAGGKEPLSHASAHASQSNEANFHERLGCSSFGLLLAAKAEPGPGPRSQACRVDRLTALFALSVATDIDAVEGG